TLLMSGAFASQSAARFSRYAAAFLFQSGARPSSAPSSGGVVLSPGLPSPGFVPSAGTFSSTTFVVVHAARPARKHGIARERRLVRSFIGAATYLKMCSSQADRGTLCAICAGAREPLKIRSLFRVGAAAESGRVVVIIVRVSLGLVSAAVAVEGRI